MFGRRRRDDDDIIGPATGLLKWVNRFFRFILYPFIHPVWFISGVAILAIALIGWPAYNGIEFAEIPNWYKQRLEQHYQKAEAVIDSKVQPLVAKGTAEVQKMTGRGINVKAIRKVPSKTELVAYDTPQASNRRVFEQAKEIPVDVGATLENYASAETETQVQFKRNAALGLTYLDEPQKISGVATVINANELRVGGQVMFLYGIYTAPSSEQGIAAAQYLQQNIDNKVVDCLVGAYAADGTATAICFYNDINLNQKLVDLNYSKDVSLN